MPSPTRLSRRWTRKNPTAGASSPTTMPAPNASRMNSRSSMCVRRVVPDTRQGRGGPVEDDLASNQDESFDESLDRAELVRDVQDGHAELVSQPLEQRVDRGLRPLREVADLPREPLDAARSGLRESDGQADERSLAAAVRAGDRDELSALDLEIDIAEDGRAGSVCERDVLEPERY